jgi:hypothetical protein
MTQPIGTSPAFCASSAAASAKSMKDGEDMPRLDRKTLLEEQLQQKWMPVLRENAPLTKKRALSLCRPLTSLARPFR